MESSKKEPEVHEPNVSEMTESEIDEALKESFPASDPPPWTRGLEPEPSDDEKS